MRLADVVALVEGWYPPHRAEEWDSVGLVCGDPDAEVRSILLAVDPVQAVADEAVAGAADLVIVHHPLYLRGTTTVAASTSKGRVVHDLIRSGCALLTAHTNADSPAGGVSEAIATALGLSEIRPLDPDPHEPRDKIVTFVPLSHADQVRTALAEAGAGSIGDYDSASFVSPGQGRFRPLAGANPTIGTVGDLEVVEEERIEVVADRSIRSRVLAALIRTHPYEEPAYDVLELADLPDPTRGSGRIGVLPDEVTLREFADHAASVFPQTAGGLRVAGDPERPVTRVALCGGAGDFLLGAARRAGADVYVTSDLRHHPASESVEDGGPALIDVAHWAAESLWLPVLRDRLVDALGARPNDTVGVSVHISTTTTDPWTFRV
ncbi:dinuclear metal center YbgI/SA1388 family protein [Marmoricola sp. OAE513]|uniref:Nif3-like dinuclear metal center hexameric protein n=1 Tax=Marmoricola sp. OAE513 TaxID=2817894 RepID=UPI001AE29813